MWCQMGLPGETSQGYRDVSAPSSDKSGSRPAVSHTTNPSSRGLHFGCAQSEISSSPGLNLAAFITIVLPTPARSTPSASWRSKQREASAPASCHHKADLLHHLRGRSLQSPISSQSCSPCYSWIPGEPPLLRQSPRGSARGCSCAEESLSMKVSSSASRYR